MKSMVLAALVLVAVGARAEGPDVSASSEGGTAVKVPIVSGTYGDGKWTFNPLGVADYQRSQWVKDSGVFQIVTVPADVVVHGVSTAPWQWAIGIAAVALATDAGGCQTWLRDQVMGGSDDDSSSGKVPTVSQTGAGVVVVVNGTGNTVTYTGPATTSTETTTAAKRDPTTQVWRGTKAEMRLVGE